MRRFFWFFPELEELIKYGALTLKTRRILSFHWVESYCGPHSSPKKGEDSRDTNTEQENCCHQQEEVEDNWSGCWEEQMGVKALVPGREKSLHHGGGWCRDHGKVLQGLKGAAVRMRSSPQASEQQVWMKTRQLVWLCLTCRPLKVRLLLTHCWNHPLRHVFSACLWELSPAILN